MARRGRVRAPVKFNPAKFKTRMPKIDQSALNLPTGPPPQPPLMRQPLPGESPLLRAKRAVMNIFPGSLTGPAPPRGQVKRPSMRQPGGY